MKNIRFYNPSKYNNGNYEKVKDNIYKTFIKQKNMLVNVKDEELKKELSKLKNWNINENGDHIEANFYKVFYKDNNYYIEKESYENGNFNSLFSDPEAKEVYVTSLMFEQEPELGEYLPTNPKISPYPLEDILDTFYCYCLDFYEVINGEDPVNSYQEFASDKLENIEYLTSIVGKHVYNKNEDGYVRLIIEE